MQKLPSVGSALCLLALALLTTGIAANPLADDVADFGAETNVDSRPPVVPAVAAESSTTAESAAIPAAAAAAAPLPTVVEIIAPAEPAGAAGAPQPPPTTTGGGHVPPIDLPIELPFAQLPSLPAPPRRIVSYDQRQEGKYNIRADLENFMIVVIPSSPSSGASLLDLLTRTNKFSAAKSSSSAAAAAAAAARPQAAKKDGPHKKYHAPGPGTKGSEQPEQPLRSKAALASKANLVLLREAVSAELARRDGLPATQQQQQQPSFIEGRTPYHVDISSAAQAARPLIYARTAVHDPILQRRTKSLHSGGLVAPVELAHNSVVLIGRLPLSAAPSPFARHATAQQRGFAWTDGYDRNADRYDSLLRGGDDEDVDDVDVGGVENGTADSVDRLAAGETAKSGNGDGWDQLTLLGADEQCGPDRRRDSYGVCQFVALD